MINRVDVDYAGGGEVAFLEGGNAAVIKLSVTMQEMQMWTREDYGGESATEENKSAPRPEPVVNAPAVP